MAAAGDKAEKQLREITECSICKSTFTDPRMLPCIHTFCFECLRSTGEAEKKKQGDRMPCVLCRKDFIIPPEGIIGLQRNFFMENLLEFKTTLQGNLPTLRIGTETQEDVKRMSNVKYCNQHNQKPLEYYCADCKIVVCVSCFVENHKSHDCKDVTTVEENVRQSVKRAAWKASNYADELLSLRKNSEMVKTDFLKKLEEMEKTITKRNQDLKDVIDKNTHSLLDELIAIKSGNLKDIETHLEEINRCFTILGSFESYCTEIVLKGSASDICSSVDQLIARADELEKDHEAFLRRPRKSLKVSFQTKDLADVLQNANGNLVGYVTARVETTAQSQNFAVVVTAANDIVKVNLQRPNDISSMEQIPTKNAFTAVAAVYCNTMYVTGVGDGFDEIWKYNMSSGWVKCASFVLCRIYHISVFIDEVLYICGGNYGSNKKVLDSVEAYNVVTDKCTIVGKLVHGIFGVGNCVPVKSSIYIFGGIDNDYVELDHVQVYNTIENTCSVLSRPMPRPYFKMRALLCDTSVVLLGLDSCFIFNIETETWLEGNRVNTGISCCGLALENESFFFIAREIVPNEVLCIPLHNILSNKPFEWITHAVFPEQSDARSCVKMRLLV